MSQHAEIERARAGSVCGKPADGSFKNYSMEDNSRRRFRSDKARAVLLVTAAKKRSLDPCVTAPSSSSHHTSIETVDHLLTS